VCLFVPMVRERVRAAARFRGGVPILFAFAAFLTAALFFLIPLWYPVTYEAHVGESTSTRPTLTATSSPEQGGDARGTTTLTTEPDALPPTFIDTPIALRGIYMTQCVVGTPSFRDELVKLIDETELNAVVIDLKDYTGKIAFPTDDPILASSVSDACGARDMRDFVARLHAKGIYVIGRITVFQDPFYSAHHPELAVKFATPAGAVWKDNKGLSFIDVGAKPYWEYIISLSRAARLLGFDELNYDYIRFPSDGPMSNIHYDWAGDTPKPVALEEFFAYLRKGVKDPSAYPSGITPPAISADLFGMVTTSSDDLNIGQVLERALPYFDYLCPMVYPSHYPRGFNGWTNPNTVPYDLIHFVLSSAVRRTIAESSTIHTLLSEPVYKTVVEKTASSSATTTKEVETGRYTKEVYDKDKIRPWLQDFDYGGNYDVAEVRAQIKATYDVGLDSWVLWAPSNRYTGGALDGA